MAEAILRVFRGGPEGGKPVDYRVPVAPGMVVLDALHSIQGHQSPDLAVRWNCKAGKCGSCSAEVNGGPRFFVRTACLEMHPLDGVSRTKLLEDELGLGLCNITKCCTEVCPEEINITDNAIIPLKERVVDEFYDPITMLVRKIRGA